jgi:hypothetical protein
VAVGEGPDEIFRTVLNLSDNMPDKADLPYNCGVGASAIYLEEKI